MLTQLMLGGELSGKPVAELRRSEQQAVVSEDSRMSIETTPAVVEEESMPSLTQFSVKEARWVFVLKNKRNNFSGEYWRVKSGD